MGFGWNTVGKLAGTPNTGKSYGVFGQGNNMPDITQSAAHDMYTSKFPRGLLLTIAPKDKNIAPSG